MEITTILSRPWVPPARSTLDQPPSNGAQTTQELHRRPRRLEAEPAVEQLRTVLVVSADPQILGVASGGDRGARHRRAVTLPAAGGVDVDVGDLGCRPDSQQLPEGDRRAVAAAGEDPNAATQCELTRLLVVASGVAVGPIFAMPAPTEGRDGVVVDLLDPIGGRPRAGTPVAHPQQPCRAPARGAEL